MCCLWQVDIAILHEGRILVNGTLAELKKLLPPANVEYIKKQPTLGDIFLALVGNAKDGAPPTTTTTSVQPSDEPR